MAASKAYFARASHQFLSGDRDAPITSDSIFELDESDVWNTGSSSSPEFRKSVSISRASKNPAGKGGAVRGAAASLPVNIPDWSRILKEDYKEGRRRDGDDDLGDGGEDWIPPHEFLARTRIASFSVHEGIGRTLKGRDLSRVRNAIWQQTGFED